MDVKCAYTELVQLEKLVVNPRNDNKHKPEHADLLAKVLKAQGIRHPIIVSKRSGFIVAGHLRLMAASILGLNEFPVDYQDFDSEAAEYQFLSSDNNVARYAELDNETMLENLKDLDIDVEAFDFGEIGLIDFELPQVEVIGETDEDAVPEVKHDPITKRGDIWLLGDHRVMCGDSTMIDDVEKLMDGEKADMVFTDPPYGVSYQSNMRTKTEKFDVLKNDDEFLDIVPIIEMFSRGFVFIWSTWKVVDTWIEKTASLGKLSNMIVWAKGGGGIGDLKRTFSTDWELALVWHRGHELTGKRIGSVWSIGKDKATDYKHPTQKPVALAEEALDKCSKSGYNIMDLFLGSGSTLIACEKTNRKCYGMELDERYCDVIINRWQDFTGKEAKLESTSATYNSLLELKEDSLPRSC